MDVSNGLLVAILFVTLLGLGIAHVVMTMAELIRGDRDQRFVASFFLSAVGGS